MNCSCFNITPVDLERDGSLILKLGTRCDSCPLLTVEEEPDRRVIPDRRSKKRTPPGRRKTDSDAKKKVVEQPDVADIPERKAPQKMGTTNLYSYQYKHRDQDQIKVHVKLNNGDQFFATMYVNCGERIQDLLNDNRAFIPVMKKNPVGNDNVKHPDTFVVLAKKNIVSIEER